MTPAERRIVTIATARHGIFTDDMAIAEGMLPSAIQRRLRNGTFDRLHPGVLRFAGAPITHEGEMRAALDWAGPSSILSFRTAGALYEMDGVGASKIELWMDTKRRTSGIICHRLARGQVLRRRHIAGFPVTTPERTLWDLASVLKPRPLLLACEDVLRRKLTHVERLWLQLGDLRRRGCPSVKAFERLLHTLDPETSKLRSRFESELKRVVARIGRLARVDHEVFVEGRRYVLDVAFPEAMVGIEAHSVRWHMIERIRYDAQRQRLLTLAGWTMLYFTWEDVISRPEEVQREIEQALDLAKDRSPL